MSTREQATARSGDDCFGLAVEAVDTGETFGALGSHRADPRMGWFEYGITIGAEHRRKGCAAEAVGLLLRFMFAERRYHKCEARIFAHNEASPAPRELVRPLPGRTGHREAVTRSRGSRCEPSTHRCGSHGPR